MSDKTELSLQSLYDLIQTKADKTHTHTFIGSIESALSLQGVTYDKFVRNDLKNQKIKAYYDNVTFGISSLDTTITFKSEHNRATLEIFNENLSTHNLWVTGHNNEDVVVSVNGKLLVNDAKVITVNDKGEIKGLDPTDLKVQEGKGIIVETAEPVDRVDGTIWGKVIDEDKVDDDTAIANHTLYTVPIGGLIKTLSSIVPNGYVRANGQCISREGYSGLWTWVKAHSLLLPDADWKALYTDSTSKVLYYSYGDGTMNFRVPNIPTNDSTMVLIKAYDNLTNTQVVNLAGLNDRVKKLESEAVATGIGFIKYADGGLIQYGTSVGLACYFSMAFINNLYTITTSYIGTANGISITTTNKTATGAFFSVVNNAGMFLSSIKCDYIAIGRWK